MTLFNFLIVKIEEILVDSFTKM